MEITDKLILIGYKMVDQRIIFKLLNSSIGTCLAKFSSIINLLNSWQFVSVFGRDFTLLQFNKLNEERCLQFPMESGMSVKLSHPESYMTNNFVKSPRVSGNSFNFLQFDKSNPTI